MGVPPPHSFRGQSPESRFICPNRSDLPHDAVGKPLSTRQELCPEHLIQPAEPDCWMEGLFSSAIQPGPKAAVLGDAPELTSFRVPDDSPRARKHDLRAQPIFMERRLPGRIRQFPSGGRWTRMLAIFRRANYSAQIVQIGRASCRERV